MEQPILTTEDDDGRTVAVIAGQHVVVRLPENPTTGYRWEPPAGVDVVADNYRAPEGSASGAGGEREVTIVAPASSFELRFALTRPWGGGAPERTFTLRLDVES